VGGYVRRPEGRLPARSRSGWLLSASTAAIGLWATGVLADPVPQTMNGVPQQIVPQVAEVGLPAFTMPTGTVSLYGGSSGTGGSSGGTGTSTDSSSLDTMLGTSWGASAEQSAQALGVNGSALAATCVIESGCQNLPGTGTITGAFQMTAATYTASLAAALAQDPNLAANIVPGLAGQSDPATQAIAAAEYLKQGAQYLQNSGVASPTALDVRGYYNFGPQGGANIANSQDSDPIAGALSMYTPAQLAKNGITSGETVGQWRAAVAGKMGSAASATVLT
jgi:predicted secreted protein